MLDGSPNWNGKWTQTWYGIKRFFEYLESKAYKMHIRVLLSKYRSYTECPTCGGARLKTESLLWRLGGKQAADAVLPPGDEGRYRRFMPKGVAWSREQLDALPGLCLHDLMQLPLVRLRDFFQQLAPAADAPLHDGEAQALKMLHAEIMARVQYLCDVGIGYLTLDRQSRTLSGGEVQRINLTTALGTSLVNTLFVLDEPSIGLHPRDMERITEAMQRLRDAGNTLVVVEHDPAVMFAADRMIDMGPGPARGGQIVFDGTPDDLRHADTLTGAYLGGRKQVGFGLKRMVTESTPRLILEGAREHNLRSIDVDFPLQRLVTITGVSGSGKSTLIQDVLVPALMRHFGKPTDAAGAFERLLGADHLSDVMFVDQSPIGKTARSNPASYVGAWDSIRELFAIAPLSRQRGYTAAKFSFNSGDGRCPTCGGSGFEHVEMQFLSDVYLRCPDCNGTRYRPEILEVTIERHAAGELQPRKLNVADVLELTVAEAALLFAQDREVIRALQPIVDVGLEYVKLGQPVPTLSGGEAQRLKLAGFLAEAAKSQAKSKQALAKKGTLFLYDEPTTGLHFDDIAKLMRALRKLLEAGHSLIVIEHNLDVIRASDWLIDLGPEGGDGGGAIVAQGTPEEVRQVPGSHTAQALREYDLAMGVGGEAVREVAPCSTRASARRMPCRGGRQECHRDRQRQGAQPQAAVGGDSSRQVQRGDGCLGLGQVHAGLRHPVQRRPATLPGIAQRLCALHRPACGPARGGCGLRHSAHRGHRAAPVARRAQVHRGHDHRGLALPAPAVRQAGHAALHPRRRRGAAADGGKHRGPAAHAVPGPDHRPAGTAGGQPQGRLHRAGRLGSATRLHPSARGRRIPAHHGIPAHRPLQGTHHRAARGQHHRHGGQRARAARPPGAGAGNRQGRAACAVRPGQPGRCHGRRPEHGRHRQPAGVLHPARLPGLCHQLCRAGPAPVFLQQQARLVPRLRGHGRQAHQDQRKVYDDTLLVEDNRGREVKFEGQEIEDLAEVTCPTCQGTRLNATARAVRFHGVGIAEIAQLSVNDVRQWVQALAMSGREADIARDLIPEIQSRLEFLEEVGLGYLTLDRGAPTLSGGEAQRIRLAAQLGSNLQGVCYVLDEPTIGLHARDNQILLNALHKLGDKGNTLVVVEHDEDTIRRADHIIDIGPSAGIRGGRLVAQGTAADIMAAEDSITGRYLLHAMRHPFQPRRWVGEGQPPQAAAELAAVAEPVPEPAPVKVSKSKRRPRLSLSTPNPPPTRWAG